MSQNQQTNSLIQQLLVQQITANNLLQNILQNLIGAITHLSAGIQALNNTMILSAKMITQASLGQGANFMKSILGGVPTAKFTAVKTAIEKEFAGMGMFGQYTPFNQALGATAGQPHAGGRPTKDTFSGTEAIKDVFGGLKSSFKSIWGEMGTIFKSGTPFGSLQKQLSMAGLGTVTHGGSATSFGQALGSGGLKGVQAMGTAARSLAKMPLQAIGALGPQMMALSFVMGPAMAFLEGLLAPFEIFGDMFGAFGEILGIMFIPIIQQLVPMFTEWIPILVDLAITLQPIITFVFNLILQFSGLTLIFDMLKTVIVAFLPVFSALQPLFVAFTPLLEIFANLLTIVLVPFSGLIELLANGLVRALEFLVPLFDRLKDAFDWLADKIEWIADMIEDLT